MIIALNGKYNGELIIDDEDYQELSQHKWYLRNDGYVATVHNGKTLYIHRLVAKTPKGMHTDHLNHNKLDNRKENLRVCTHKENMQNIVWDKRYAKRGTVHKIIVKGYEYWTGVVKVDLKRYQTTTCATKEMAQGALKQMIVDKKL